MRFVSGVASFVCNLAGAFAHRAQLVVGGAFGTRDRIDEPEAGVVPGLLILIAGVPQTNN